MVHFKSVNFKHFTLAEREAFLQSLTDADAEPSVLLRTCNRIEQYSGKGEVPVEVARYLFRLVSGLESAFVGETAIQGQVKKAYLEAAERNKLPESLHRLFQAALRVGKRVRTESALSQGAMSHSQAVIEILEREEVNLETAIISIIGVNKMNEDIIRYLQSKKAYSIFLSNRSYERAQELAEQYGCSSFTLDERKEALAVSDVVISATSAPHTIIRREHITPGKPLLLLDLAFPRDIEEQVGAMPHITLYNLEDLNVKVNDNISARRQQIVKAEAIIEEEVALFTEELKTRRRKSLQYSV